ncbi:MAG: hypothetical protein HN985_02720 [Planctomycetaceae bacterium]|nr:hypothetical protein [Planctomycetaceae bacterium]
MVRVVLFVLVAAGFFVTGDIPTLLTGCQCGFLAVQNQVQSIVRSKNVEEISGVNNQEEKDQFNHGSSSQGTSTGVLHRDQFPPNVTRSVNLKELVAGSRLVLWLVKKNGVHATQLDVLNPVTGEVLVTPTDASAQAPKRGHINTTALREGGEVSLQYKQQSEFNIKSAEPLGAILAIERPRLD